MGLVGCGSAPCPSSDRSNRISHDEHRPRASDVATQVRVPKAAELVAAQLRGQIVRGVLGEGDALPPEHELMQRFGVSRPTLREALRVLEGESLLSIQRGAHGGARIHTPDGDAAARYAGLALQFRGATVADVYRAHCTRPRVAPDDPPAFG